MSHTPLRESEQRLMCHVSHGGMLCGVATWAFGGGLDIRGENFKFSLIYLFLLNQTHEVYINYIKREIEKEKNYKYFQFALSCMLASFFSFFFFLFIF